MPVSIQALLMSNQSKLGIDDTIFDEDAIILFLETKAYKIDISSSFIYSSITGVLMRIEAISFYKNW